MLDVLYTVREAGNRRPGISVGYSGEFQKFNEQRLDGGRFGPYLVGGAADAADLALDLVEEEINLHGLKVVVEGRLNKDLSYFVAGTLQYDFFDEQVQYSAGAGIEYNLNDRLRLVAGLEYYSAGQTASSDSGVLLGTAGFSLAF